MLFRSAAGGAPRASLRPPRHGGARDRRGGVRRDVQLAPHAGDPRQARVELRRWLRGAALAPAALVRDLDRRRHRTGAPRGGPPVPPHGPHPGTVEKSIGKEKTEELAVMIDPFRPLMLTEDALKIEDENYHKSWQYNIE